MNAMKNWVLFFYFFTLEGIAFSQDLQYAQFYAAPLTINPALAGAGTEDNARVILNYRNQWPHLNVSFISASLSYDQFFPQIQSGIGLIYTHNIVTSAKYRSQNLGAHYAYQLAINEDWKLRVGMEGAYTLRSLGFSSLTFGDQFTNQGLQNPVSQEAGLEEQIGYVNLSLGTFLYSEKYWLGIAAFNLTRPRQNFLASEDIFNRLPIRYSVQVGAKFNLTPPRFAWQAEEREMSISPTFLYKRQGNFNQLDLGVYTTLEPVVFGLWYRGIPFGSNDMGNTIGNEQVLSTLVGILMNQLAFGYSYDFALDSALSNTGGAHEISLRLFFEPKTRYGSKRRKYRHSFPCPKF